MQAFLAQIFGCALNRIEQQTNIASLIRNSGYICGQRSTIPTTGTPPLPSQDADHPTPLRPSLSCRCCTKDWESRPWGYWWRPTLPPSSNGSLSSCLSFTSALGLGSKPLTTTKHQAMSSLCPSSTPSLGQGGGGGRKRKAW